MVIIMKPGTTQERIDALATLIRNAQGGNQNAAL